MLTTQLFEKLLKLPYPYTVRRVEEQSNGTTIQRVDIFVEIKEGYQPRIRSADLLGFDSMDNRTWQHLSVFQIPCYLHCQVPKYRFKSKKTGRIYAKSLPVPWSGSKSNLTSDLEEWAMELIELHGNIANVSKQLGLQNGF